jgi:HEAT repeat protein
MLKRRSHLGLWIQAPLLWGFLISQSLASEPLQDALLQLKSNDVIKRRVAVQELVTLRNSSAAPALITALSDPDAYVRTLAVRALGNLRWSAAKESMSQALLTDTSPEVRQTAALSLRYLDDPEVHAVYEKALHDPVESVQLTVIKSLAYFKNPDSIPALMDMSKDKSPAVRKEALIALGEIRQSTALPVIKVGLHDPEPEVSSNVQQALLRTQGTQN